jgi:hypothetical protein
MTKADVRERAAVARSYLDTAARRLDDAPPMGPSAQATVAAGNAVHARKLIDAMPAFGI